MQTEPAKYQILSGSVLKCLAMITMLIDHTAVTLFARSTIVIFRHGSYSLTLYTLMRKIGRIAFPLFVFLLVEGFLHTRDRKRYGISLFLFALLSEIPWNLEHTGHLTFGKQNVFFTLFLGYMALCVLEHFREQPRKQIPALAGLYLITLLLRSDYGVSGFGLIVLLYALREQRILQALLSCCFLSSTWVGGLAFIPISLYNGQRGFIRSPFLKYAFYAVYPVHLLVLFWLKKWLIGF